jgi:hypothetical protein
MPGDPEQDDDNWFKPAWECEDEDAPEPPGPPRARRAPAEADYAHPLLLPLARAQNALARLEAKTEAASDAVAEGLRARMSYLEAAGWLSHAHFSVHPWDLALRDHGLTISYGAADHADRIAAVLPSTTAQEGPLAAAPSDIIVNGALRYARLWRRLAEFRTWRPLADADKLRETLKTLDFSRPDDAEIADWLTSIRMLERGPDLILAGRAARGWMNLSGIKERNPDGIFLAACLWHDKNARAPIPLPFWSAPAQRHQRLALRFGLAWIAEFLECVAAAAMVGLHELNRLQEAENKGRMMGATARSRLPQAVDAVLRVHIVTTASLAKAVDVTPQAALGLIRLMMTAGIVREATGRASWRAFVIQ